MIAYPRQPAKISRNLWGTTRAEPRPAPEPPNRPDAPRPLPSKSDFRHVATETHGTLGH